ncbi:MAG: TGS domain-containing protein, partial [Ilumatobacteraceae bacterium]
MTQISVTLPDGSHRDVEKSSSAFDLASSISRGLAKVAVAAEINAILSDLSTRLEDGDTVRIITADSDEGRHVLRHSTAHVMAQAVTDLFPSAKFTIGPAIEHGFYYDFDLGGQAFTESDLERVEQRMREIVKADQPFVRSVVQADEALRLFADQPYKREIIERVRSGGADGADAAEVGSADEVSLYRNSESFVDLCLGPHVPS